MAMPSNGPSPRHSRGQLIPSNLLIIYTIRSVSAPLTGMRQL